MKNQNYYDLYYIQQLDLERQRREENELKREISMKNAAIDELKMELKNKMCLYIVNNPFNYSLGFAIFLDISCQTLY